ncbi:MAG: heparinase II/III family protein [Bacteroidales bacterium]|nr:heparinase II/III family protein [Bacteroidales bacterium]
MRRLLLLTILLGTVVSAQEPVPHPRLLMREGEEPLVDPESMYAKADSVIVAFSDVVLGEPAVTREMVGRRMLGTSREALKRIFWLGYTYRTRGGEAYARKAIDEMLAVSAFPDWNPAHFLDVGEMTMAVAIGYDWFYDQMTPRERKTVATAIIDKGLKPALNEADAWFYRSDNNWNSVCNAGMVFGALAVWEEDPDFCRSMLEKSLESNKLAYKSYEGGGYAEGYNYWGYGSSFQIMLEAALASADVIPSEAKESLPSVMPGLTGHLSEEFIRFTSTPAGNCYSFSDSYRKASGQYMQAWMARQIGDSSLLYPEFRIMEETGYQRLCEERLFPMFIIRLSGFCPIHSIPSPTDHYFQCGGTTPIFVYRSGWKSREDDYLGIKGGLAMSSHSHCDQGSFYFESDGVTWATDLGMQDYESLESAGVDLWDMTQDSERWEVFRIGPFSHNILTVNGHTPKVNHPVAIGRTWKPEQPSWENRLGAMLDLTECYTEDLDSCKRAVFLHAEDLHILDLIQAGDSACTVRWAMCTEAAVSQPDWSEASGFVEPVLRLTGGWHRRELMAEFAGDNRIGPIYRFPAFPHPAAVYSSPELTPRIWPTTYDPAAPDIDGMQYLHPTDAPNPGTSLVGYTFTLQPHQKVVLHVTLKKVL